MPKGTGPVRGWMYEFDDESAARLMWSEVGGFLFKYINGNYTRIRK